VANVFEVGYRAQPSNSVTYSITGFRHNWDHLRSGQAIPGAVPAASVLANDIEGFINGMEAWATYQPAKTLRLSGGFTTLREHLTRKPGSTDAQGPNNPTLANDPDQQWKLRVSYDIAEKHEMDIMLRHVSSLPLQSVPAYTALDLRWGWRVARDTEVSLTLENINDREHAEFGAAPGRSELGRSAFLRLRWQPR
jgi:iron complex outermembrane receptor protein